MTTSSQGLLRFQNGGVAWTRLLKFSKNGGVFCHVTRDEIALSEVISNDIQSCLFSGNLNPLFKRNEDISHVLRDRYSRMFTALWQGFGSIVQAFLRPLF